jgi:hypothetical protein
MFICLFLVSTIHLDQLNERLNRMETLLMNVLSQPPVTNGSGTFTESNRDSRGSDNSSLSENASVADFVENFIRPQVHDLSTEINQFRSEHEIHPRDENGTDDVDIISSSFKLAEVGTADDTEIEDYPQTGELSSKNSFTEDNQNYHQQESESKSLFGNPSSHTHLLNNSGVNDFEEESDERYSLASESPEELRSANECVEDTTVERGQNVASLSSTGEDSKNPELVGGDPETEV